MKSLRLWFSRFPIKWKLTLWSALLLFLLFAAYNAVQYVFVESWMVKQAETNTKEDMREILNYLLEKEFTFEESEMASIRSFLEKVNERNQLIRLLDEDGDQLLVVSENIPERWMTVYPVGELAAKGTWFLDDNLLLMRSPLTIFSFNGTVEIVKNNKEFEKLSTDFFRIMLICCFGAVIISGIGGGLLARQLLKPIQTMNDAMVGVKNKGVKERVQLNENKNDEIASLMKLFNEMMDQLERSFDQQKQFVEDASHELRTPVAIMEGHMKLLKRWGKDDPVILEESLDVSIQELARLKGLVQELLALSRAEKELPATDEQWPHSVKTVRKLIVNMKLLYPDFQFEVELEPISNTILFVSEQHLEQILLILLNNAIRYSGESKLIKVLGILQEDKVLLSVIDFGIGISETDLPLVTNRFYRADRSRSGASGGHGLGLSIATRLVQRYDGRLLMASKVGEGTIVTLVLQKKRLKPSSGG
ncbi:HAMP domain-containing histidine kinase [Paenibacillus sinopodophylli]|uniref:HAMP domain-containing histidine kinase n=1 Tax=Paenibacillus sinopodophylli TaxID=1837342 RepID=UPI00110D1314|nr:HAMP domain-containing histidine kinase [Paenibacillus sinopodophylli]